MTHTSPVTYLVWTVLVTLLEAFLVFHLWSFDRFQCLRWNNGPNNGAFKRLMTYSYLITIPMILTFALGNTIIKYNEGFIVHPINGSIIPKPFALWGTTAHNTVFPLMVVFAMSWSFEMVTHLEELCFWLFLVNSGSSQQNWFQSPYFKTWVGGSVIALVYMPLVTILTRDNLLKAEAYTFLAGSLGSMSLTLWFTPILWTFPSFLANLRREGVDTATIVRLTKFSELNTIRVVFRFMFTVPLLILGIDGVRPHNHINESMLWTDLLSMLAGFGCTISSAITLVIFFPRSIEGEIAAKDAAKERRRGQIPMGISGSQSQMSHMESQSFKESNYGGNYLLTSSPIRSTAGLPNIDESTDHGHMEPSKDRMRWEDEDHPVTASVPLRPNRRRNGDVEMGGVGRSSIPHARDPGTLTDSNLSIHNAKHSNINPAVTNFRSPIDFAYALQAFDRTPRLAFKARR